MFGARVCLLTERRARAAVAMRKGPFEEGPL